MPSIGPTELIIVLVILLLIVGPGRLPAIGSAFGRTLSEFRKASSDVPEGSEMSTPARQPNQIAADTVPNVLASEPETDEVRAGGVSAHRP